MHEIPLAGPVELFHLREDTATQIGAQIGTIVFLFSERTLSRRSWGTWFRLDLEVLVCHECGKPLRGNKNKTKQFVFDVVYHG